MPTYVLSILKSSIRHPQLRPRQRFAVISSLFVVSAAAVSAANAQLINGDFEFEHLTAIRDSYDEFGTIDICETNSFGYGCVPDTADDGIPDRQLALQLGSGDTNADVPFYYYRADSPLGTADPNGEFVGRTYRAFSLQSAGGVGPFQPIVPSGWTLKRVGNAQTGVGVNTVTTLDDRPVFLTQALVGGQHTSESPDPNGTDSLLATGNTNEDVFFSMNTDSTSTNGRFFTPAGNDPSTLNSQPDWLASGNNVVLLRNRNNRVLDASAGDDQGRGTILMQETDLSVSIGEEVTVDWLVGDRIGALQLVDYDVVVRAGGTTIFSTDSVTDTSLRPFNDNGKTGAGVGDTGTFKEVSRSFTATAGGLLEVSFGAGGSFASSGGLVGLDNIRLSVGSSQLLGDADGDGDVDGDDLIAVQTNFGSVTPPPGDADSDGDVDGDDLIAVQTNFGATADPSTTASVPEPAALGLVILGVVAAAGSSCRSTAFADRLS